MRGVQAVVEPDTSSIHLSYFELEHDELKHVSSYALVSYKATRDVARRLQHITDTGTQMLEPGVWQY